MSNNKCNVNYFLKGVVENDNMSAQDIYNKISFERELSEDIPADNVINMIMQYKKNKAFAQYVFQNQ